MLWYRWPLWCPVLAKVFLKFWCIYLWDFSALLKWIFFVRLWLLHLLSQFVLQPLFSPAPHFFSHPSVLSLCSPLSFISLFVSVFQLFYACWVMHYKAGLLSYQCHEGGFLFTHLNHCGNLCWTQVMFKVLVLNCLSFLTWWSSSFDNGHLAQLICDIIKDII